MCLSIDIGCDNICVCCEKPCELAMCEDCQEDTNYYEELRSQGHTPACASKMAYYRDDICMCMYYDKHMSDNTQNPDPCDVLSSYHNDTRTINFIGVF